MPRLVAAASSFLQEAEVDEAGHIILDEDQSGAASVDSSTANLEPALVLQRLTQAEQQREAAEARARTSLAREHAAEQRARAAEVELADSQAKHRDAEEEAGQSCGRHLRDRDRREQTARPGLVDPEP